MAGCPESLANTWKSNILNTKTSLTSSLETITEIIFLIVANSLKKTLKSFTKISPAILSSIDVAHILMKRKKPFTDAEETIKECVIQIVDNFFGKTAVEQVKKIPLSDTTIARRCIFVAKDLKEQLLEKLRDCTCFGLQLDESVDVSGEAQLLVYCRFPDITTSKMSEHMRFCDAVVVQTTGKIIIRKIGQLFYNRKTPMETPC